MADEHGPVPGDAVHGRPDDPHPQFRLCPPTFLLRQQEQVLHKCPCLAGPAWPAAHMVLGDNAGNNAGGFAWCRGCPEDNSNCLQLFESHTRGEDTASGQELQADEINLAYCEERKMVSYEESYKYPRKQKTFV